MTRVHSLIFSLLSATLLLASNPHAQPRRLVPDHKRMRHSVRSMKDFVDPQNDTRGFEWDRHGDKAYVRFLLSSSIDDPDEEDFRQTTSKTPIMIAIPGCVGIDWNQKENALVTALNKRNLSTMALTSSTDNHTRYSSTFYATAASNEPFDTRGNAPGWPIEVTASSGAPSGSIGWDVPKARNGNKAERGIKWTTDATETGSVKDIRVDCASWWYEHEASGIWTRPQYYGRKCRLQIPGSKTNEDTYCITADGSPDDPRSFENKTLKYDKCIDSKYDQQSTALEWPKYFKDGTAGWRYEKDPLQPFQCGQFCASNTTDASQ